MVRLDDFTGNVAKSGLVPPEVVTFVQSQLDPLPAEDAAVRLARQLVGGGWLTAYQAPQALWRERPGVLSGGLSTPSSPGRRGHGKSLPGGRRRSRRSRSRCFPPRKALEEETLCGAFAARWNSPSAVRIPTSPARLGRQRRRRALHGDGVHPGQEPVRAGEERARLARCGFPTRPGCFSSSWTGSRRPTRSGLVHRDIKPSNIMITPDGDVKLLDMGLARALDDETGLTRANTVLGTLDYASPEQLRDAAKADMRSDLYSVGCTLYFALAGRAPFEGGDMINKIYKQRMEDPDPLENVARGVPAAFAAVVRKLMSKEPEERYQNCAELRGDLMRWTDPARVRAILGTEADAARSFRPPPPELVDEDLRLLDRDDRCPAATAFLSATWAVPSPRRLPGTRLPYRP